MNIEKSKKWTPVESLGWHEDGRIIELTYDKVNIVKVTARYEDFVCDGEDEYPIYRFESEEGEIIDLWAFEYFRFC